MDEEIDSQDDENNNNIIAAPQPNNNVLENPKYLLNPGNERTGFRRWIIQDIQIDQSLPTRYRGRPTLNWPRNLAHIENKEPIDYFLQLFPMAFIQCLSDDLSQLPPARHIRIPQRGIYQ